MTTAFIIGICALCLTYATGYYLILRCQNYKWPFNKKEDKNDEHSRVD